MTKSWKITADFQHVATVKGKGNAIQYIHDLAIKRHPCRRDWTFIPGAKSVEYFNQWFGSFKATLQLSA